jgi:hypothetical protein
MKNIKLLLEQENKMRALFNAEPLELEDIDGITNLLSSKLSPENLHRDGEASRAEVNKWYAFYQRCIHELEAAGHTVNLWY